MLLRLAASLLLLCLSPALVSAQALHEKAQVYFGVWPDSQAGAGGTPASLNARLGFNASAFQIAQLIPLPKYNYTTGAGGPAPEYLIEQTMTDAAVLLTVYPAGFNVSDQDLVELGKQLASYTRPPLNRTAFLRFGPEMQGTWNPYGFQPTDYVSLWKRMYQTVKSLSPETALVWAPNTPQSYPYGQSTQALSAQDLLALDTNHDGQVTNADDPFMPFYPGDDFVDWIGLSSYYKGPNHENINVAQPFGFCASILNGTSGTSSFDWYGMFCNKPGKACMIAESGAAYHMNATQLSRSTARTALDLQRAWWQDCITSPTYLAQFPRLKMTMHFEHAKLELDGGVSDLRDYRITNDTTVLEAFKTDFQAVASSYWIAGYRALDPAIPPSGRPTGAAPGAATPTGLIFQTARNPVVTGPPSLFGARRSDALPRFQVTSVGLAIGLVGFTFLINMFLVCRIQ